MKNKNCPFLANGISADDRNFIDPNAFYPCLFNWFNDTTGGGLKQDRNFVFTNDTIQTFRKIQSFKLSASTITIPSAAYDGPGVLFDIREIEYKYGLPGTFSYANSYLDFE